jgi:hypothetical protein
MDTTKNKLLTSLRKLEKWIEDNKYRGYDPFDGLLSPLRLFTFRNLLLDRILMQLVRQNPLNFRPFLGIKPQDSTIARGYMALGYLQMFQFTGNRDYADKAINCLDWLAENKAPGFHNYCWGKHFDYASRGGRYSKLEPITVWTSIIGQAFLDAYEILHNDTYLQIANSVCTWILEVPRNLNMHGICIEYTTTGDGTCTIHNQSMLAAAMLARTAQYSHNDDYLDLAKQAMKYSCSKQLANGGWFYGESSNCHWIDNFHTGYNLDSLKCYIDSTKDSTFQENLQRGLSFYTKTFFEDDGKPKYYHNRTYPIDIQCASQAIESLTKLSDYEETALQLAVNVATWTIDNMQDTTGYFYYRALPVIKARAPMIHWGQATTYNALALLYSRLNV